MLKLFFESCKNQKNPPALIMKTSSAGFSVIDREEIKKKIEYIRKDVKAKTKLAAKYYRNLVLEIGNVVTPVVTMDKYISKIANLTKTDVRVERLALEIAAKTETKNITDGKAPNGIASAYLYVSSVLLGQNVLQRDVSTVSGITEVTIRNRVKEILSTHKMTLTLRPILAKK